jgi:hypothetical protein
MNNFNNDAEENEYLDSWVDTSVTLSQWERNRNFDHWDILNQMGLSDLQIEEIEQHQYGLFRKYVKLNVEQNIKNLELRAESIKPEIIKEHVRIINLFVQSIEVTPFLLEILPVIRIRNKDYLGVIKEWQKVIFNEYNDFKTDFSLSPTGLYSENCYLSASILYEYRNRISALISEASPPTKREINLAGLKNYFDNVGINEIYNHFKAGLVEKGYLTEEELKQYLKAAFDLKTIPEKLFKLKHTPTKQKIYTVFYVYYKDVSDKKHERQREYAALLGEYFEGYDTKIIQTNWARDYKTKR